MQNVVDTLSFGSVIQTVGYNTSTLYGKEFESSLSDCIRLSETSEEKLQGIRLMKGSYNGGSGDNISTTCYPHCDRAIDYAAPQSLFL